MPVTYYVDIEATPGGNGETPATAYDSTDVAISGRSSEVDDITLLCRGTAFDNSSVNINGTSATSWRIEGSGDANGRYTGFANYSEAHFRIEQSANVDGFQMHDDNITVVGIQFFKKGANNKNGIRVEGSNCRLEGMRMRSEDTTRVLYVPPSLGAINLDVESCIIQHMGTQRLVWTRSPCRNFRNNGLVDGDPLACREGYYWDNADHNLFINNAADWDFAPQVSGDRNATTGGTIPNLNTNEEINLVAGTDFAGVNDLRPVPGGKAHNNGDNSKLADRDINGNTWSLNNRGPYNDVSGAGPIQATGQADAVVTTAGAAARRRQGAGQADTVVTTQASAGKRLQATSQADAVVTTQAGAGKRMQGSGQADAVVTTTGAAIARRAASGQADVVIGATGSAEIAGGPIQGTGVANIVVGSSAAAQLRVSAASQSDIVVTAQALAIARRAASGQADVVIGATGNATVSGKTQATGQADIVVTTQGAATRRRIGGGQSDVIVGAVAAASVRSSVTGQANITITATAETTGMKGFTTLVESPGRFDACVEAK